MNVKFQIILFYIVVYYGLLGIFERFLKEGVCVDVWDKLQVMFLIVVVLGCFYDIVILKLFFLVGVDFNVVSDIRMFLFVVVYCEWEEGV